MKVITERITPDPRFDLLQPRSGELRPVDVHDNGGNRHTLETYYVPSSSNPDTRVLVFQPWSECVGVSRAFNQRRIDMIADITGGHVLGIDNPGIGNRTSRLSLDTFRSLARGSFREVIQLIWDAIEKHPDFDIGTTDELMFIGHSLGSSVATETAAHAPDGIEVGELVLLDPAVSRERSIGDLALTLSLYGRANIRQYQEETGRLNWERMGSRKFAKYVADVAWQPEGHLGYGLALSRTPLGDSIEAAYQSGSLTPDSIIWLINGGNSRVCPTPDGDALAQKLAEELGILVKRLEVEGATHAVFDSFPRMAEVLRYVRHVKEQKKMLSQSTSPQIRT